MLIFHGGHGIGLPISLVDMTVVFFTGSGGGGGGYPAREPIDDYIDLVTSEHRDKPKFIETLKALIDPLINVMDVANSMAGKYDLNVAVGQQLDTVGEWVGRTRLLTVPLTDVYFSFDIEGLGYDQGYILGPFDPLTGLVALSDEPYRTLLRATIAANHWDGSIVQAYAAWDIVFQNTPFNILIIDNGDMTMDFALMGGEPDAVTKSLLTGGYLALKPSGVRITNYFIPSVPHTPLFGFDLDNDSIAGFDVGSLAITLSPT